MNNNKIAAVATVFVLAFGGTAAYLDHSDPIVGTYKLRVVGARYEDHLFQFDADGNFKSANPQRVQENPDGSGVNDSLGLGWWKSGKHKGEYYGKFVELNSHQGTSNRAGDLVVTWTIHLHGKTFTGDADAVMDGEHHPAQFKDVQRI